MAKHVTAQQAQELAARYQRLHSEISHAREIVSRQEAREVELLSQLASSGTLLHSLRRDLEAGYPTPQILTPLVSFLPAFNKANACIRACAPIKSIERFLVDSCSDSLELIKSAPRGLARLMSDRATLNSIDYAYHNLEAAVPKLENDISSVMDELDAIAYSPDTDPCWSTPCDEPGSLALAAKLIANVMTPQVPEVAGVLDALHMAEEVRKQAARSAAQAKEDVRRAVERYRSEAAEEQLAGIPVEVLGQMRRRIRVKTLRDNGYLNLADLRKAGPGKLSALNGISSDAAYEIDHHIASRVADLHASSKIRLSADLRDTKSTCIVLALAKCRGYRAMAQTIANFTGGIYSLADDIAALVHLSNPVSWPFLSLGEKREAIDAYRRLESFGSGSMRTRLLSVSRRLSQLSSMSSDEAWGDFKDNPVAYTTLLEEIAPDAIGSTDAYYGLPEALALEIQHEDFFPEGLLCTLRRYQEWGVKYILHQERVLLGDEMGLGKTIQAIATMVSLRNTGATHFIVVCPASVLTNWYREIKKNSLLKATMVYGPDRKTKMRGWVSTGGVAVTTYETVSNMQFAPQVADMVVVDEAHYVKNPNAARSKAVAQLCAPVKRVLFMTGTPLENKVDEMIELIRLLRPSLACTLSPSIAPSAFRQAVVPVYYRRKREDVLSELPELIESEEWCQMTPQDEQAYFDAGLSEDRTGLRRVSWTTPDLRNSSKAQRLREIVEEARQDNRKVLVFSFYLDTIGAVRQLLGERCSDPINGSVPPERRQRIIDDFDASGPGTVLPAQIMAGGTGLNIQSASVVVICEPQYKPSIENQAISRAYRMGQARNVVVYRLLCPGTVDERFHEILGRKQREFDMFADKSVAAAQAAEIDDKTAGNIIEEEIERIKRQAASARPSDN